MPRPDVSSERLPFERKARFVFAAGIDAAMEWGHPSVGPGHLLAGFLQHAPELVPELNAPDAERQVRAAIERSGVEAGEAPRPITYDRDLQNVLAASRRAAGASGRASVTLADLLEGLRARGDDATALLIGRNEPGAVERAPRSDADDMSWLQLSDESSDPYHQQVADRLRDAVAIGRLLPGQRLPTVRGLAQILDLAPGTVAKAYRALDAEGVIETAGTRGTMVARPATDGRNPEERLETLVGLLRPVAVAAFHIGGSAEEFREAARRAAKGVLES